MNTKVGPNVLQLWAVLWLSALNVLSYAKAEAPSGAQWIASLQQGGYVIVMRHASSPSTAPTPAQSDPENVQHERQLDASGRSAAHAMGDALHRLRIPVGEVLCSPAYRALETVRMAQFGQCTVVTQLGDSGHSMQADPSGARAAWLRAKVLEAPPPGTNTIIVTHYPNITEAFAEHAVDLGDGEALIFRPDGHGGAAFVNRMKIDAWSSLGTAP